MNFTVLWMDIQRMPISWDFSSAIHKKSMQTETNESINMLIYFFHVSVTFEEEKW